MIEIGYELNPTGIEGAGKFSTECFDAIQEKTQKNIEERDGLIRKFLKGWTSCCFPPNILWRNPFHWNFKGLDRIQSYVLKGHAEKFPEMMESFQNPMLFPPFQMGPKK